MISIVTISYNNATFLRQCIDSVLCQEGVQLQYIIVDAGSSDGSRELISSYGDRIEKIFECDRGPSDGLYKGLELAKGEILGFINADDFYLKGALNNVVSHFDKQRDIDIISGIGLQKNPEGIQVVVPSTLSYKSMLMRRAVVFQPSTFFRASLYKRSGKLNRTNQTCWDYELFLDFLKDGAKHTVMMEPLAVFRVHATSLTGSGRLSEVYKRDLDRIYQKHTGSPWGSYEIFACLVGRLLSRVIGSFYTLSSKVLNTFFIKIAIRLLSYLVRRRSG